MILRLSTECVTVIYRITLGLITCLIRRMLLSPQDIVYVLSSLFHYSVMCYQPPSSCNVKWHAAL
jgi:hypothetical protein